MTREEAVKILRENKEANGKKGSPYSVFDWLKAHDMAIRSIEAWQKLDNEVYGCICEYEGLNAYKTDAWHDGRVEGMKMIQHIINKHLKEVEE